MVIVGKSVFQEKNSRLIERKCKKKEQTFQNQQRKYFQSLNPKRISKNKSTWKSIHSFFSEKRKISQLVNNKESNIFEDHLLSEELDKFFENITKLQIKKTLILLILIATKLTHLKKQQRNIEQRLYLINLRKATTSNSIPQKLLKSSKHSCSGTLKTVCNNCSIKTEF